MKLAMARLSLFIVISTNIIYLVQVACIPPSKLYPFGAAYFDSLLTRGDEAMYSIGDLPNPFPFFGELHLRIFITNDGLMTLSKRPWPGTLNPSPQLITTGDDIIAPFWADVDTTLKGQVWFRVTTDEDVLQMAKKQLLMADKNICNPLYSLIVTWNDVSYYRYHYDKTNTFQCVLTTDGSNAFAIFIYKQNGIQWTTGDASGGTFGMLTEPNGVAGLVGVSNNGTYTLAPASGTQNIINISNTSNVNIPGVWIFQLNGKRSTDCATKQEFNVFSYGTLISMVAFSFIILLLILGVIYGYFQVGKYILAQRDVSFESPLQEKLISKEQ